MAATILRPLLALLLPVNHVVHSFVSSQLSRPSSTIASPPFTAAPSSSSPLFRKSTPLSDSSSSSSAVDETAASSVADNAPSFSGPQLGAWIPLASASSLEGLDPVRIRVCGLDLAVWRKPSQTPPASSSSEKSKDAAVANAETTEWSAFVDACPHRLAPLSQGRVDPQSGCLECPYHGWAFDSDGSLKTLPQLENDDDDDDASDSAEARRSRSIDVATGKSGSATSLPVHAAGDLLFVFLPTDVTGESWPISLLPEDQYPYLREKMDAGATWFVRDLPYSFDFLVENFMDPAHIPFAHHSLQGTRDDGSPIEMKALENNFTHVECTFEDVSGGKRRDGVLSFQRPAFYHFRTRPNPTSEYVPRLLIFAAPVEEGRCRAIMPDFPLKFLPKWLGHLGSNRFLNTDTWLHDAERAARITNENPINERRGSTSVGAARTGRKPVDGLNYVMATKSDLGPALFRRWWSKHGYADSPPNSFGPARSSSLSASRALSRAEQIDPWRHHAANCSRCRRALGRMRALQKTSVAVSAIGAILTRNRPPIAIALVLVGLFAHDLLRKFATTIEGNYRRAEIDDRSVAAMK